MKYRSHTGSLKKSLETAIQVFSEADLIEHINNVWKDTGISFDRIKFEYSCYDRRTGWDTYYVMGIRSDNGETMVVGMSDNFKFDNITFSTHEDQYQFKVLGQFNYTIGPEFHKAMEDLDARLWKKLSDHLGREATEEDVKECHAMQHPPRKIDPKDPRIYPDTIWIFYDLYYRDDFLGQLAQMGNIIIFMPPEGHK